MPRRTPQTDEDGAQYAALMERACENTAVATRTTDTVIFTRTAIFCGTSWRETTGSAAAVIELYDGLDTTGELLCSLSIASNGDRTQGPASAGPLLKRGLFLHVVSGSVKGSVWARW